MAGYGIVSLTGAFFGYQVGQQIDGVLIGVIMAINAAIFCALLFSIVAGWVERAAGRRSNPNSQNPGTRHTR
jgi:hypothetical protein